MQRAILPMQGRKLLRIQIKADEIIDDLSTKLKDRATKISDSVDEESHFKCGVAKNTDFKSTRRSQEATQKYCQWLTKKLLIEEQQQIEKQHSKI